MHFLHGNVQQGNNSLNKSNLNIFFFLSPLCGVILSILTTQKLHPEAFTAVMSRLGKKKKKNLFSLPVTMRETGYCNIYTHMRLWCWAASTGVRVQKQQGENKKEKENYMLAKYSTPQSEKTATNRCILQDQRSPQTLQREKLLINLLWLLFLYTKLEQSKKYLHKRFGPKSEKKRGGAFCLFNFYISKLKFWGKPLEKVDKIVIKVKIITAKNNQCSNWCQRCVFLAVLAPESIASLDSLMLGPKTPSLSLLHIIRVTWQARTTNRNRALFLCIWVLVYCGNNLIQFLFFFVFRKKKINETLTSIVFPLLRSAILFNVELYFNVKLIRG